MTGQPCMQGKWILVSIFMLLVAAAFLMPGAGALTPDEIIMKQITPADTGSSGSDNGCANCREGTVDAAGISAPVASTEGLSNALYSVNLNGGYVAHGVGMRNRGWGTIVVDDMPNGSTKTKAYLWWSVIGSSTRPSAAYATGKFNGNAITGTLIGSGPVPCWGGSRVYVYRYDATALVTGTNNLYHLTDFATGNKFGTEPFGGVQTYPTFEGASLVIVYSKSNYPYTSVKIMDGVTSWQSGNSSTTFTGLPSYSLPVAKTTFIVSDGQNNAGKNVYFNGIALPSSLISGSDRQNGVNYRYGNLQDTSTTYVKVSPGATTATATIQPTTDCLVWMAQVLSVSNGNLDTDGDALKDAWEIYGYDKNGDGIIDVYLPGYGANPYHKDLFIWIDYMTNTTSEAKDRHKPDSWVLNTAAQTFAKANYVGTTSTANVDGTPGITLHSYIMYPVPHQTNLAISSTNWAVVDAIKNPHMPAAYQDIFHYCLFGHGYDGGSSSGISRGIPASDFVVMLGLWGAGDTDNAKVGTYVHEFGHNLGLKHGGTDHTNYKPNYLDIMNYFFQIDGVYRNGAWNNYDYQRINVIALNENALVEADGIGTSAAGYGTKYYCPSGASRTVTVNKPIDWNCNGVIDASAVKVNINGDKDNYGNNIYSTLTSQLNWQHITFNGGSIGGISAPGKEQIVAADKMEPELTYDQYVQMKKAV